MGRGKHQASLDLIQACYDILEEIQPATVRAVCYRLFVAKIIPDMTTRSTRKVSEQLFRLPPRGRWREGSRRRQAPVSWLVRNNLAGWRGSGQEDRLVRRSWKHV